MSSNTRTSQNEVHVTAAVSQKQFEELQNEPSVKVQDYDGMGQMSEFDVFVSYTHVSEVSESDSEELTPQEEWEQHNEQFSYEPPELPGDAWSSEQYQELYDRFINRRTQWFCRECSGKGPMGSLQKARRHVESQHANKLIEKYETPREELEAETDGGKQVSKHESENHGLGDF